VEEAKHTRPVIYDRDDKQTEGEKEGDILRQFLGEVRGTGTVNKPRKKLRVMSCGELKESNFSPRVVVELGLKF